MSYVNNFSDYTVTARVCAPNKVWMIVENPHDKPVSNTRQKYFSASGFVYGPNFIEKLCGVTWQDKLAAKEKKLFKELLHDIAKENNPVVQSEVDKFLNS